MTVNRRGALALLGLGAGGAGGAAPVQSSSDWAFGHGVASGDPLQDRVILWTRLETGGGPGPGNVSWELFADAALKTRVANGLAPVPADRDFTVKVDVSGLKPGVDYWYRFAVPGTHRILYSPVGRTRTLPVGKTKDVVLAVANCSLYPGGFFNAYQAIADLKRVDAVVHLGDYIYEYGADTYGSKTGAALGRLPTPAHECVSLADYRERHACHKADPQLQAAHARAPWIVSWDDHETANDSYETGAENHQPAQEGDWDARKAAAIKAYYEWMPIREPKGGSLFASYRSFHFGDLAALVMTETRLTGRTHQLNYKTDLPVIDGKPDLEGFKTKWNDPARRMMGPEQEAWIGQQLAASVKAGHAWQVLGNQVVMAKVAAPDLEKTVGPARWAEELAKVPEGERGRVTRLGMLSALDLPYNLDSWDGYPADRQRLLEVFKAAKASPIVLSGDSHTSWANQIFDIDGKTRLAAEFGATAITSPGAPESLKDLKINDAFVEKNPEVVFCDQFTRGFLLLTLTRGQAMGALMGVSTVVEKTFTTAPIKTFAVKPAKGGGVSALREV